jgi:signal peptidase II
MPEKRPAARRGGVDRVERDVFPAAPSEAGKWRVYGWVVSVVLLLDIVTKVIAQRTLPEYRPVPVLGDFFRLTYIFNPGAAFGLHLGPWSRVFFAVLALVAVVILFFFYRGTPPDYRGRRLAIALVTGGALGNFIDRIRSPRGVIDFFDFGFGDFRWPVFNVADIAVTTGAILLAISLWQEDTEVSDEPPGR